MAPLYQFLFPALWLAWAIYFAAGSFRFGAAHNDYAARVAALVPFVL